MQDHFGFPINARPFSAIGTLEKVEIAEVLNQMVKRACEYEKPKIKMTVPTTNTTTTTTTTTTTAYRKGKTEAKEDVEVFKAEELVQPVQAAYPNLVSIVNQPNKFVNIQNGYDK